MGWFWKLIGVEHTATLGGRTVEFVSAAPRGSPRLMGDAIQACKDAGLYGRASDADKIRIDARVRRGKRGVPDGAPFLMEGAEMAKVKGTLDNPVKTMKRAIKFASREAKRPIITAIHLDGNGDVVSTDSYRLYVEWRAWHGPSINIDYATAYDIAHCKVKGNDTATFEIDGTRVEVTMGDGTKIVGEALEGKYPNYAQLMDELETYAMASIDPKQLLPIAREHVTLNDKVRMGVKDGAFFAEGTDGEPKAKFEGCGEGESYTGIDPRYLRDALGIFGSACTVRIMNPIKPIMFTDDENVRVLVMPVRIDEGKPKKKEEHVKESIEVGKDELAKAIYHAAIDRAANDKDGKVQPVPCTPRERDLIWKLEKAERLGKSTWGAFTNWYLDGEFVCCIERRYSKRKIRLCYPELKPKMHKEEHKGVELTEKFAEEAKKRTGVEVEEHADVTAVVIEPKKLTPPPAKKKEAPKVKAPKAPEKKEDEVDKRIEELEAKLKAMSAELEEVWKENAKLKAAPKVEPKVETAATVSLKAMEEWCEGKGLVATQKKEGCCIWVEGESKPYAEELKDMGFRFAKKRRSWYFDPKRAA